MNKEPEEQGEPITGSKIKNEEGGDNLQGNKEEPDGTERNTESIPENAQLERPVPTDQQASAKNEINSRVVQLEKLGMLQNIPHFQIQRLKIGDSLIQPIQNLGALQPPRFGIANLFPSLFTGITTELTRSLRITALLPGLLNQFQLPKLSVGISPGLHSILGNIPSLLPPLVHPRARMALDLGWIVHRSLPTSLLEDTSEEDLDEAILTHYREQWSQVRIDIELATKRCLIDEDSKETMHQALTAHEHKLYRLVPRAMVTEIDRATRVQLHKKIVDTGLNVKKTILNELDELPVSSFYDFRSTLIQYEIIANHLYEQIPDDNKRSQVAESAIPNRHAAVHGLVPYATEKSSLNSLFLADFVFGVITISKKQWICKVTETLNKCILARESEQSGPA